MLTIRQATAADVDLILPLFEGYRTFYKQQTDTPKARTFLKDRLTKEESLIFLACVKEEGVATPIGFTQLYPLFSSVSMEPMIVLNDLYVHPHARGKGIGRALIDQAKSYCLQTGQKGILLQTGHDNPAQHLYEREGFKKETDLFYFWASK